MRTHSSCLERLVYIVLTIPLTFFGLGATAQAQKIIAHVALPSDVEEGIVTADPALNQIYVSGGFTVGRHVVIVNGSTFSVKNVGVGSGAAVDLQKDDNYWAGDVSGHVLVYDDDTNTVSHTITVGFCPGEVTLDCERRQMWAGAQCGGGNDPVFAFDADTFAVNAGPIGTGGVMGPIVVNPGTGRLYVTTNGVSKRVNPSTFAVTTNSFGNVLAVNSTNNILYAASGMSFQIINGAPDPEVIRTTISLTFSPASMAVNNALNHLYLVNQSSPSVQVRDGTSGALLGTFSLGTGNVPLQVAADSTRGRVYVTSSNSGSLSLFVIEDLTTVRRCRSKGGC